MAVPIRRDDPSVFVDGRRVVISNLEIDDSDLVQLVSDGDDPVKTVRDVASVGARVIRMTQTTIDAAVVEKRFEEFEKNLDELLAGGTADVKKAVRDLVDPGNPESPLGRLKHDLTTEMKELRQIVTDLKQQVAVDQAAAEMLELTAIKGRKFEELVFDTVASIASLFGDDAEPVGDHNGSDANKCGDAVVTLNPDATPGATGRIVIEVKDRRLTMRETHAELERAIKNRDARAGVIVFSRQHNAPTAVPLQMFGSKVVVVLDKDDPDEWALKLGIAAARCVVQRQLASSTRTGADIDAALECVEKGRRALLERANIRRCLTQAGNAVDQLVDALDDILHQIAMDLQG
jgi:hypothetical protein